MKNLHSTEATIFLRAKIKITGQSIVGQGAKKVINRNRPLGIVHESPE